MSTPETPDPRVHPILNLEDLTYQPSGSGGGFEAQIADIGWKVGAVKLGYNVTVVPPGKAAFPFHSHTVNEEMFVILSGSGELRLGDRAYPLRAGDVVACPPGGPETAHQISNTGQDDLRYLAVGTTQYPEITEYPDSGKFGVVHRVPGAPGEPSHRVFRHIGRPENAVDYWDGEGGKARPAVNPNDPDQITDRYQVQAMRRALAELRAQGKARTLRLKLPQDPSGTS